jgi:hypothetical protein
MRVTESQLHGQKKNCNRENLAHTYFRANTMVKALVQINFDALLGKHVSKPQERTPLAQN